MALTGRKLKFAAAVIAGFSNKDAAIKAGYSPATASPAGSRLVKDKDVVSYLKQHKKDVKKTPRQGLQDEPPEYVSPISKQVKKTATPRTRGSVWMNTRARILERDGNLCQCKKCQESGNPLGATEVDHRIPLHLGGTDEDENLQALNDACHKEKTAAEAHERAIKNFVPPAPADTPREFFHSMMNDINQDPRLRLRAAIAADQHDLSKTGGLGKKGEKAVAAKEASSKFTATTPPPASIRKH